eukprot:Seg1893.7 transcript_id=Seg1893.7/GoldUCD/mRNA.D3Y31 product="hypothetical protein" protein_id=Seg1893.7/GoldUCD/D3Y31
MQQLYSYLVKTSRFTFYSIGINICPMIGCEVDVTSPQRVEDIGPEDSIKEILSSVPAKMQELLNQENLEDVAKYVSMHRFLVTIEKLVELKGTFCKEVVGDKMRGLPLTFSHQYGKGTLLKLSWSCSNSHFGHWLSSEILASRNNNNNVYVNDILVSSSVLLSGNNYTKYSLLCKALNQHIPSISSYSNVQKLYTSTVIMKFWNTMKSVVMEVLDKNAMCLSGDGRNDSPGHSARFCTYVLMEHFTKLIVDFQVTDKRETKGISTNMEVHALKKLLLKLKDTMNIVELVTDASTSVAKLVRDMKDLYKPLENLYHGMDMWHKAKLLNKKLHIAAKVKGQEELQVWIDPIVNHFWFCCQECKGDLAELKETWTSVLHHVCGEHI